MKTKSPNSVPPDLVTRQCVKKCVQRLLLTLGDELTLWMNRGKEINACVTALRANGIMRTDYHALIAETSDCPWVATTLRRYEAAYLLLQKMGGAQECLPQRISYWIVLLHSPMSIEAKQDLLKQAYAESMTAAKFKQLVQGRFAASKPDKLPKEINVATISRRLEEAGIDLMDLLNRAMRLGGPSMVSEKAKETLALALSFAETHGFAQLRGARRSSNVLTTDMPIADQSTRPGTLPSGSELLIGVPK